MLEQVFYLSRKVCRGGVFPWRYFGRFREIVLCYMYFVCMFYMYVTVCLCVSYSMYFIFSVLCIWANTGVYTYHFRVGVLYLVLSPSPGKTILLV